MAIVIERPSEEPEHDWATRRPEAAPPGSGMSLAAALRTNMTFFKYSRLRFTLRALAPAMLGPLAFACSDDDPLAFGEPAPSDGSTEANSPRSGEDAVGGGGETPASQGSALSPGEPGRPGEPALPAETHWVFDDSAFRTYSLTLDPAAWENLQATARDEVYVPADLEVDGERLPQVGLRFKGGFGSLYACFDEADQLVCPKLSMKIRFDEYDPEQRLHGLKRLNFNSMRLDPSHLHDRLAYRVFREMGVLAPRAAHARLVVNGEYLGVFSLVEQVDGRFTDDRFEGGGDGNLYKEQWPETDDLYTLTEQLKTNEETADHSGMLAFYAALRDAAPAERTAVLEAHADVDQIISHLVVDRAINNWDGMTGFYCSEIDCDNYNYYIYQHEDALRFTIIPWDPDQTFAVSTQFDGVPSVFVIPADCSLRYEVSPSVFVQAPACDPLLEGVARADRARITEAFTRLLSGPFTLERMDTWIDAWAAQIEPGVAEDTRGPGVAAFRAAVATLRDDLRLLRERAEAERDERPIERFNLLPGAVEGFESTSALEVGLGIVRASTAETRVGVDLGSSGALRGQHDLRMSFEFRDGDWAWSQWAQLRVPLASTTDARQGATLRFWVRSDTPRVMRISLDSLAYSDRATSGEIGWDVELNGTPQELVLDLSTASFPAWGLPVPESAADLLASVTGIFFEPAANGRGEDGLLGAGVSDAGEIRIDDLQLSP